MSQSPGGSNDTGEGDRADAVNSHKELPLPGAEPEGREVSQAQEERGGTAGGSELFPDGGESAETLGRGLI